MIKQISDSTFVEYLENGEGRVFHLAPDKQKIEVHTQCSIHFIEELLNTMDAKEVEIDLSALPMVYKDGWDCYRLKDL